MYLVAVNILLNLAEDISIERKMKKRKISTYLIRLLERNNTHLIMITLIFLKKLSTQVFHEPLLTSTRTFYTTHGQQNQNFLLIFKCVLY